MSVGPNDSRPLPAASTSSPLLNKTLSRAPLIQLPTDNEISHRSDILQLSADNEMLSAALSLSLLAQPTNSKSCWLFCNLVQILEMQQSMY
jgi:hypothetical protein